MPERMSQTEAVMWTVEKDPSLRSDFLNLTILDRAPDLDRLKAKLETAFDGLPRLRQRVVTPPMRLAPPEWVDDPQFDLDYHVRRVAVPPPGTRRQLLDLAATLAIMPFDRARPLWDLTVVEGLEDGKAALLQKVHHTIIDGVGGVRFSTMLLDLERDPPPDEAALAAAAAEGAPAERTTPLGVLGRTLAHAARQPAQMARGALAAGTAALRSPRKVAEVAGSIRDQVFVRGPALSPLMTGRSFGRRFDLLTVSLADAKATAQTLGGTVNDVFVAGIAGGLGLYHERMGVPVDELRLAMPISMRERSEGVSGNRFSPARVPVPVLTKDPIQRFAAVHERLHSVRAESALNLLEPLAGLVQLLPTSLVVPITRAQSRTIDFIASNLRGAPVDLYLGGALIEHNHPMGPCTGAAVNVTTLSYRGNLDMGVNTDTAAVTDGDTLVECLAESFDELVALA